MFLSIKAEAEKMKRRNAIEALEESYIGGYSITFFKAFVFRLFSNKPDIRVGLELRRIYDEYSLSEKQKFLADTLTHGFTDHEKRSMNEVGLKNIFRSRVEHMETRLREQQHFLLYTIIPEAIDQGWTKENFKINAQAIIIDRLNERYIQELGDAGLETLVQDYFKLAEASGLF